jgi:pimeloyl-ACP methyl ester carboxylesterase
MDILSELAQWRASGTLMELGGHRIFVREAGQGPPLLCLHGFPTASFDYARLLPLLLPHYRLLTFDFLGYGFSDKPRPYTYSLFEQAMLAEEVAARRGITETALLAHDMGTSVALIMLQRARLRVSRLVLLNGSILLEHYQPLITQRLLLHPLIGQLVSSLGLIGRSVFAHQFGRLFPQPLPRAEIDAFWSLLTHNDGAKINHLLIKYLDERKRHELQWLDALVAHPAPLLIIWGQRDPVSVPRIAEAIRKRRPDALYVPLSDIGHYPQWEAPETVAREVQAFVG